MEKTTTSANCVNICPVWPLISKIGRKTTITVMVEATTALVISLAPETAPSVADCLSRSMCRKIFSNTTTASSTIRPVASARPESEMVLSVKPQKYSSANVEKIETGIESATTSVLRTLRRKNKRIRIAKTPPMIAVCCMSFTEFSIKPD